MFREHPPALRLGVNPLGPKLAVVTELLNGHAGLAEASKDLDPEDIVVAVATMSAVGTGNVVQESCALIVPKGVDTHSRARGHLRRGEGEFVIVGNEGLMWCLGVHGDQSTTRSALQVKEIFRSDSCPGNDRIGRLH